MLTWCVGCSRRRWRRSKLRRELTAVERVTIERQPPLVPCCRVVGKDDRWRRVTDTCGALIPYKPQAPCPECHGFQARPNAPVPNQDSRILTRDTAIIDAETGKVVVVYVVCATGLATRLADSLRDVEFDTDVYFNATTTTRLSGMAVTHRTFGYQPPQPMRRRYGCSRSQFNAEHPKAVEVLTEFCRVAEHVFRTYASDVHDVTARKVRDTIPPAWLIAGTPWSSGIINQTCALPYHKDTGNIPSSWSAMLGCRRMVEGGLLHLADYGVYLPIDHGSITIFDGQSVTHGVTPLTVQRSSGWRYTVVTYAKSGMRHCCPDPADEPARAARALTEAEDRRLAGYRPTRGKRKRG